MHSFYLFSFGGFPKDPTCLTRYCPGPQCPAWCGPGGVRPARPPAVQQPPPRPGRRGSPAAGPGQRREGRHHRQVEQRGVIELDSQCHLVIIYI